MRKSNTQIFQKYLFNYIAQNRAKRIRENIKENIEAIYDEKVSAERWENEGGHIFELSNSSIRPYKSSR